MSAGSPLTSNASLSAGAALIANARMYAVTPAVGKCWQRLFGAIAEPAGARLNWFEYPAPAPLRELWSRPDLGAVFMCGLPYSRSVPRPELVAAPVPRGPGFDGKPCYWSELVVHADSPFRTVEDTFGRRIALTTPDSQSGCLAVLHHLTAAAPASPLYSQVIEPQVTPVGAASAVLEGRAEVAPVDSFALALLQRHKPELTAKLRSVGRTEPTPIPPIIASQPVSASLETAFLEVHNDTSIAAVMADLNLERFARPCADDYDVLRFRFESAAAFWHERRFATTVHPDFAGLL